VTHSLTATQVEVARPSLGSSVRLVAAGLLGAAAVLATLVPTFDGGLAWVPLVPVAAAVTWCALPTHLAAGRGIAAGRWSPDVLASVGLVAALAWSVADGFDGSDPARLAPVAIATVLVVAAQEVVRESGTDNPYAGTPGWIAPLGLAASVATLAGWWLVDGPGPAATAAVSTLLVAAPVALRVAGPAALLVAARRGAGIGMAPADEPTMDVAARIDTIVLDQHGTVTTGELSVTSVDAVDPEHLRNLRWFAGALEHVSEHPIGRAIAKLSAPGRVTNVLQQPGLGISGSVDRHPVRVGLPSWIGIDHADGLGTQVAVEVDGRALGSIRVADTLRADAHAGVEQLRGLGLDPMLVSDRAEADTSFIAAGSGIVTSHPSITTQGRIALIQRLRADGRVVAMAGDRGRHPAAMQAADLPISTATASPRDGIAVAEVDVCTVAGAIALARGTRAAIRTNRRWALAGMLLPLPFAAAGLLDPVLAAPIALVSLVAVGVRSLRIPPVQGPRPAAAA
jgi:Cu+-exporting ATPase